MPAVIDKNACTGCENCVEACPVDAISMVDGKAEVSDECIDCGQCVDECPVDAIEME
ncbi:MAG: 4Fe-4S binding protein [Candidatus Pacebacteria bacterium]|nr:4Fe-4S binding protein [Candidatus Paceibacterota bacterium]